MTKLCANGLYPKPSLIDIGVEFRLDIDVPLQINPTFIGSNGFFVANYSPKVQIQISKICSHCRVYVKSYRLDCLFRSASKPSFYV